MITKGSVYRGCAGHFDSTISSRPFGAYFNTPTNPPPFSAVGTWWFGKYYSDPLTTGFLVPKRFPKVAPYGTRDWLRRASHYPLANQYPVDSDGVPAHEWPAPNGWGASNFCIRVPRSLIIVDSTTSIITSSGGVEPNFLAAMNSLVGQLWDLRVDVYLVLGSGRFSDVLSLTGCNYARALGNTFVDQATSDIFTAHPISAPATDMDGADVMVVNLSDVISGYNSAVVSLSSLPPKTDGQVGASNITTAYFSVYVAVWDPSYTPIELSYNQTPIVLQETTDSQPTFDTKATYVYYDQQAEAERDALIDYGARLRKFRYDVGGLIEGTTFNPGPAQIDLLPLDAADSMVRGSLPGVAFPYSFFNLPAAASTIVANAVSFFS